MKIDKYLYEVIIGVAIFFGLLFVTTNSNQSLGMTYLLFLGGAIGLYFLTILIFDKRLDVTVKKNDTSNLQEFLYGGMGWVVLMIASWLMLKFADPTKASIGTIMNSLNAANPVFSNSVIINFVVIAFFIPFTETVLWGRGVEFVGDLFGIKINNQNKTSLKFIAIIVIPFAALFAIFHATSKNLSGSSLLIVAIMMIITIALFAMRNGDMRSAIALHVFANSIAAALLLTNGGLTFGISGITNAMIPICIVTPTLYNYSKTKIIGLGEKKNGSLEVLPL